MCGGGGGQTERQTDSQRQKDGGREKEMDM